MNLSIYGAGYVGLVTAACLAKFNHHVLCVDINEEKIQQLKQQHCPIFEAELPELLKEMMDVKRLTFSSELQDGILHSEVHFIATGTPTLPDGATDLSQVFNVAEFIAKNTLKEALIVIKSTVPVGTCDKLIQRLNTLKKIKAIEIMVASNPEFLKEGTSVEDFLNTSRIVIGGEKKAIALLKTLYAPLLEKGIPLIETTLASAELAKLAANSMLALRISFMNFLSQLAEKLGASIDDIKSVLATDKRIGPYFLNAGIGFGGSCFPKDLRALIYTSQALGVPPNILESIVSINEIQKQWVIKQLQTYFSNDFTNKAIGIWGLSFKPGTDDIREACGLVTLSFLIEAKACLYIHDPAAMEVAKRDYPNTNITWCDKAEAVLEKPIEALVILTEWPVFVNSSLVNIKEKLGNKPIFDGRNCWPIPEVCAAGLNYHSIGR